MLFPCWNALPHYPSTVLSSVAASYSGFLVCHLSRGRHLPARAVPRPHASPRGAGGRALSRADHSRTSTRTSLIYRQGKVSVKEALTLYGHKVNHSKTSSDLGYLGSFWRKCVKAERIGVRWMLSELLTTEKPRALGSEDYCLEFAGGFPRGGTLASHFTSAHVTCIRWGGKHTQHVWNPSAERCEVRPCSAC